MLSAMSEASNPVRATRSVPPMVTRPMAVSSGISNCSLRVLAAAWHWRMTSSAAAWLWRFSASWTSKTRTWTSQPIRREVRRAFWPLRPMALERSLSSWTITKIFLASSSTVISRGSTGLRASRTKVTGSSVHSRMSTFSLLSSRTMFLTRAPRMPTHAPTGSTLSSWLMTATLVR